MRRGTQEQDRGRARTGGRILAVTVLALGPALASCGGTVELKSTWCDREVLVDGRNTEWAGALTDFPEQRITVGVMNDDDFLYLGLFVGDERTRRMAMMGGFTIWFDDAGADESRRGIRYPVGPDPAEWREDASGERGEHRRPPGAGEGVASVGGELEILGPDEEGRRRVRAPEVPGVEVAVKPYDTSLAYELRVPLAREDRQEFGVGAGPGQTIGVTVTIGGHRGPMRGGPRGDGPPPEVVGPGGTVPGGIGDPGGIDDPEGLGIPGGVGGRERMGGRGPGGRPGRPRTEAALEIRAKVHLAASPALENATAQP